MNLKKKQKTHRTISDLLNSPTSPLFLKRLSFEVILDSFHRSVRPTILVRYKTDVQITDTYQYIPRYSEHDVVEIDVMLLKSMIGRKSKSIRRYRSSSRPIIKATAYFLTMLQAKKIDPSTVLPLRRSIF